MFLWVFVAALICSHLSRLYQSAFVDVTDFTISDTEFRQWVAELDPSAKCHSGGAGSSKSGDEVDSETDYYMSARSATAEQVLSHLRNSVKAKIEADGWTITGTSGSSESFQYSFSKGVTRFKIHCWTIPADKSPYDGRHERDGRNFFRLKVLQFGYVKQ